MDSKHPYLVPPAVFTFPQAVATLVSWSSRREWRGWAQGVTSAHSVTYADAKAPDSGSSFPFSLSTSPFLPH